MKRFTCSEKYDDPWFIQLPPKLKVLWDYICVKCDCAGIFQIHWPMVSMSIGDSVSESDLAFFGDRIEKLSSGRYLIRKFIHFQYVKLSPACFPHKKVLELIDENGLIEKIGYYTQGKQTTLPTTLPPTPRDSLPRREQVQEEVQEEDQEGGAGGNQTPTSVVDPTQPPTPPPPPPEKPRKPSIGVDATTLIIPDCLNTPTFVSTWSQWMDYRKAMKHNGRRAIEHTFRMQLTKLEKLGPEIAIQMIERSIYNGWIGLIPMDDNQQQQLTGKPTNGNTNGHHKANWGGLDRNAGTYNEGLASSYEHMAYNDPLNPNYVPNPSGPQP